MSSIGTIHESRGNQFRGRRASGSTSRLAGWLQTVEHMLEKRRTRRALLELTDYQLKDIGFSRSQVHREASRPFWD